MSKDSFAVSILDFTKEEAAALLSASAVAAGQVIHKWTDEIDDARGLVDAKKRIANKRARIMGQGIELAVEELGSKEVGEIVYGMKGAEKEALFKQMQEKMMEHVRALDELKNA